MAQIDNSAFIGAHYTKPSAAELDTMKRYDSALGSVGHAAKHDVPPSAFAIPLMVAADVPAATTSSGVRYKAPFPLKIWAIDAACESAAGATGDVDVFSDDGVTDASILDAPEDVKTTAGTAVRIAPEEGKEEIAYGTELYLKGISGAGGAMAGTQAILWVERR